MFQRFYHLIYELDLKVKILNQISIFYYLVYELEVKVNNFEETDLNTRGSLHEAKLVRIGSKTMKRASLSWQLRNP